MIDLTCALFFSIPLLLLLAALSFLPSYLARQNQKTFDVLLKNQELTRLQLENERKKEKDKAVVGIKLQAYERMTLFLERIKISNLLVRVSLPSQNGGLLHASLIRTIREEYEHNMSQQLYISDGTWELIKSAKEEVIKAVNTAASKVKPEEEGSVLAKEILSATADEGKDAVEKAMAGLKKDMQDTL
jgi:hypothetical protein